MMTKKLLKFENVSYSAREKIIVSGINWSVDKGEHWVILGPNGAGKSTLLKLIYGLIWPNTSGIVYRKGKQYIDLGQLRKSIGLVSPDLIRYINSKETVLETVISGKYGMFGYWERSDSTLFSVDKKKANQIMAKLKILQFSNRTTRTLSTGEMQKVLLAPALMSDPYLILLDEPLAGVDPGAQESFLCILNRYIYDHSEPSFIYITHHVNEIIEGFTKMLMMKNGKIFYNGDISVGLSSKSISELYDSLFELRHKHKRYHLHANLVKG